MRCNPSHRNSAASSRMATNYATPQEKASYQSTTSRNYCPTSSFAYRGRVRKVRCASNGSVKEYRRMDTLEIKEYRRMDTREIKPNIPILVSRTQCFWCAKIAQWVFRRKMSAFHPKLNSPTMVMGRFMVVYYVILGREKDTILEQRKAFRLTDPYNL